MIKISTSLIDYFRVIFGSASARGLAFINSIMIARGLGPDGFGVFSLFFISMVLTWQISSSFDTTYIRYAKATNNRNEKSEFLKTSVQLKIIFGGLVVLFFAILGEYFAQFFLKKNSLAPILTRGVLTGFFLNFQMSFSNLLREKENYTGFVCVSNLHTVLIFTVLITVWMTGNNFKLDTVMNIYLFVAVMTGTLSLAILPRRYNHFFTITWQNIFKSLGFGKWILLLSFVFFIFQRIDIFFLTRYLSAEDIGIYAAAVQMIMVISVSTGALNSVFMPKAIASIESGAALRKYLKDCIAPVLMIVAMIGVLSLSAPFVVALVYGEQFKAAVSVFRILSVGWMFIVIYLPFSFLFFAMDEPRTRFLLECFKLVFGIVLLTILVPMRGIEGGALSIVSAMILCSLLSLYVLRKMMLKKVLVLRPVKEM